MKIKQAMRYQLYTFARPTAIYYGIMLGVHLLTLILTRLVFAEVGGGSNGAEFSTAIFLLIMGLNAFKSPFQLFVQNSISRRTMFFGFLASALLLAAGATAMDSIYPHFFPTHSGVTLFQALYAPAMGFGATVTGLLWTVLVFFEALCAGFLLTTLFYRMSKLLKVVVSAGVPILLFVVLPVVETLVPSFRFYSSLFNFIGWCLGADWGNVFGGLHAVGRSMLVSAAFSAVMAGLAYLLMRRATFKESA